MAQGFLKPCMSLLEALRPFEGNFGGFHGEAALNPEAGSRTTRVASESSVRAKRA